jgi:hypothetical protein
MQDQIADEHLAFHADRVFVMAWICTQADKIKSLAHEGSDARAIPDVCDEIIATARDFITDFYSDAAQCGISEAQIQEFTIFGFKNASPQERERLLGTCGCQQ